MEPADIPMIVNIQLRLFLGLISSSLNQIALLLLEYLVSLSQQTVTNLERRLENDILRQIK